MNFDTLTDEQKLIYLAGLIDGEGCLKLSSHGGGLRPIIQLNMTHAPTVKAFADHFGLKFRELNSPSRVKDREELGHKQLYHARTECRRAYEVIKELLPYLNTKYEDALVCLAYYDDRACVICGNKIPHTRNKRAVTCCDVCYTKYKNKYDAELRKKKKEEALLIRQNIQRKLACEAV